MAKSYTFQGTPSFILAQKHRALKKDLKWNREEMGGRWTQKRKS